jgi:hypothetical protein
VIDDVEAGVRLDPVVVAAQAGEIAAAGRASGGWITVVPGFVVVEVVNRQCAAGEPAADVAAVDIVAEDRPGGIADMAAVEEMSVDGVVDEPLPLGVRRQSPGDVGWDGSEAVQVTGVLAEAQQRGQVDGHLNSHRHLRRDQPEPAVVVASGRATRAGPTDLWARDASAAVGDRAGKVDSAWLALHWPLVGAKPVVGTARMLGARHVAARLETQDTANERVGEALGFGAAILAVIAPGQLLESSEDRDAFGGR